MLISTHFAAGLSAGRMSRTRPGAGILGLVSHFTLDLLRYEDPPSDRDEVNIPLVLFDIGLTSIMACHLWRTNRIGRRELLGGISAIAPDVEHVLPWNLGEKQPIRIFPSHAFNQRWHSKLGPTITIAPQIAIALFVYGLALKHGLVRKTSHQKDRSRQGG